MNLDYEKGNYKEGLMLALSGYQLIEASLKLYLRNYFKIVKYLISEKLYFGFDGKDYDNAPLGRLIDAFSKTCSDTELVSDLKQENTHRNHIAHKATLELYKKEPLNSGEYETLSDEIETRCKNIKSLLSRLKDANSALKKSFEDE